MQDDIWFRPLVWMDYRLAVLFTVVIPLILLIWAFVQNAEAIQRLLIIYWRVSSLLAITLYLMIATIPISFVASLIALILIPISLWFWVDINEEIGDLPQNSLKLALTSWRWAITVYSTLGALLQIPFLRCAFLTSNDLNQALKDATQNLFSANQFCSVWLEPPLLFKQYFHANTRPGFLGFLAIVALMIYVLYLSYFVLVRLGKQGRSAIEH